ncbi:hypothetical protein OTU49_004537 [Cherax quadricarinatus]|uniref:Uncharacterized protein n=1 Tax=Cherax quadricarinatus TaxID=27406 RepID=A0AAW0WZM8_CHEQU
MQDSRHATQEDTAAMTGAAATLTMEPETQAQAQLQSKSELSPTPVVTQPSPTQVSEETSVSSDVCSIHIKMATSLPPPPAEGETTGERQPPHPPQPLRLDLPSDPCSHVKMALTSPPPSPAPQAEGETTVEPQPLHPLPLQLDLPLHHTRTNGIEKVSPKEANDKSTPVTQPQPVSGQEPATQPQPESGQDLPGSSPIAGPQPSPSLSPAKQSPQDAPPRPPSHQNPRRAPHNPLPRPPGHGPQQMRHPPPQGSLMGRPVFHGTSLGQPMHQIPPMIPPPRHFPRVGHVPSFPSHMVVMPPQQVSSVPQQFPQRPLGPRPGPSRYQGAHEAQPSQEKSEASSQRFQHEAASGEDPGYKEEETAYQEGAAYQGEEASAYMGQVRPTRRQPGTLRISKWVNPIPPDPDDGQQQVGEQELATKMLQIQSKRFYIDVKQNRRGRFMKVAEIGADGRRNQVFLALSTAAEFRDHLSLFSDFYANLGPPNPDTLPEDGKLKSETMVKDNRRYYLDLKENSRGRFLRVSQTIARGGPRCQIAIPAQGMIEFRDALQELLDEFGTDDGGYKGELPEGRHMRVENKNFYFDIGQNNRGIYMRISEVKTNFRTAITIPEKSWSRFRDIFADYVDKMKDGGEKGPSESNK